MFGLDFFSKFFGDSLASARTTTKFINIQSSGMSVWNGSAYENDIYRSAVDAIARNAAKLKGVHVITNAEYRKPAQEMRI